LFNRFQWPSERLSALLFINSFDCPATPVYLYWRAVMLRHFLLPLAFFSAVLASGRDKQENWLEVRSPHFRVITNANEKTGRRIADQFERMQSVFHTLLPKMPSDDAASIIVLAIKDEKDFRALEPQAYLAKGQLKLGGLFLRAPDKNYILMRVDAEGEHPYSVVYHEYTHFLLRKAGDWLPLWLNEGLAEFYQNTEIHEKQVSLGEPSAEDLQWLRQNRLLPLATLLTVDSTSPYYHEENKGSIFYSESWALTHYIYINDLQNKTQRLTDYAELLAKNVDPVTAAGRAFGDLRQLQSALEGYIHQGSYRYFKMATKTEVDDSAFKVEAMPSTQADAVRADFLAYNDRAADSRALLDHILQQDPNNVSAHETMGFLEFRQGHIEEARKWYAQAVKLDSQSYLAHYYFAAISMNGAGGTYDEEDVESSLRVAIKLNPKFAPAFERLAAFEGMRRRNLDDARLMGLTAVQLDPGNVSYRVTYANILMMMERPKDAVTVLRNSLRVAKNPEETAMVQNFLMHAEQYSTEREQMAEQNQRFREEQARAEAQADAIGKTPDEDEGGSHPEEGPSRGARHFIAGRLKDVHCKTSALDLNLVSSGKTIALHSSNYYKVEFSALGFTPKGDLKPCTDLEGMSAKVGYVDSQNKSGTGQLLSVELHK
jgi:cytochrome c-type biogenesis protein CcmH/NrfG